MHELHFHSSSGKVFDNILARLETEGKVSVKGIIVLFVKPREYEIVNKNWKEFKNYVQESTGKLTPVRTEIQENEFGGKEHYIYFQKSLLAHVKKFLKGLTDSYDPVPLVSWETREDASKFK